MILAAILISGTLKPHHISADEHIPDEELKRREKSLNSLVATGVAVKPIDFEHPSPNEFNHDTNVNHSSKWTADLSKEYAYTKDSNGNIFGYFCYSSAYSGCALGFQINRQCGGEIKNFLWMKKPLSQSYQTSVSTEKGPLPSTRKPIVTHFECSNYYFEQFHRPSALPLWSIEESTIKYSKNRKYNVYLNLRNGILKGNDLHISIHPNHKSLEPLKLQFSLAGSSNAINAVDAARVKRALATDGFYKPLALVGDPDNIRVKVRKNLWNAYMHPKVRLPVIYTFHGYSCIDNCEGHKAGYAWAIKNYIVATYQCTRDSKSFIEGCYAFVNEQ